MVGEKDKIIKQLEKDFSFLKDKVLAVLLFGSLAQENYCGRSDIDICIVAPDGDPQKILKEVFRNVDVHGKNYDVKIFEELPLYLKIQVINSHEVIFGDKQDLYEYFYKFRKIWKDQEHRQKVSKEELLRILKGNSNL